MTFTLHLLGVEVFSVTLGAPPAAEEDETVPWGLAGSDVQLAPEFGFGTYE